LAEVSLYMYLEVQRDAVLSSLYFTAKSLYVFRVSPAPVIRSTLTVVTTTGTSHAVNLQHDLYQWLLTTVSVLLITGAGNTRNT